MARLLPPQVLASDFDKALREFRNALGRQWVFDSDEDRHSYTDHFSLGDPNEHEPSAAVAPASVPELQAVLKVANRYKIPVWPISMGKNFAYGGAAPRLKGSVI